MIDKRLKKIIHDVSLLTPEPERAEKNLTRFFDRDSRGERFLYSLPEVAALFAYSQFLANYSIQNPASLEEALKRVNLSVTRERLKQEAEERFPQLKETETKVFMKTLRRFKKDILLWITLRDILGKVDLFESMQELTNLAEVILEYTLEHSLRICTERYGHPSEGRISIIGLGKLGGEELNYSSDIDIIGVYDSDPSASTSGVLSPTGVRYNRISNHQFFCKVMETLSHVLSQQTEDGFVYRVDTRLRPQGQRGELALSIEGYREYYQTWGRTWERMVLIRARPLAGDISTAERFLEMITPFVWFRPVELPEIEEIRTMKKGIDSLYSKDDIKRGYGGIREAEFFVQTLQLMYGRGNRALRTHRLFNAIQALRWMDIIPSDELTALWENYLYLRRLEHYLQMRDDLQTHKLPSKPEELDALARKMKHRDREEFLSELKLRRMQIKSMYNSLLGTEEDVYAETKALLMDDLSEEELKGYLSFKGVKDTSLGLRSLNALRQEFKAFRTEKERALLRSLMPLFVDEALRSPAPEDALLSVERFFGSFGTNSTFLEWFHEQPLFTRGIVTVFAMSRVLTRLILSEERHLSELIEDPHIRKSLRAFQRQLERIGGDNLQERLAEYRRTEEIRAGMFFLLNILQLNDLMRQLSNLAEALIVKVLSTYAADREIMVVSMGKLGGREMVFGSDLDLLFVSATEDVNAIERVIKVLTSYTDKGPVYQIDMRLRPDGSKGPLTNTLDGYRRYYLERAHPWEIQALLKARPITGGVSSRKAFMQMTEEVFRERVKDVRYSSIRQMRERIIREVSHEQEGLDVKFGPGGVEEIEFFIQWLQLSNIQRFPFLQVQNTLRAINRLFKAGILSGEDAKEIHELYIYLRKVEVILRLNEETVLRVDDPVTERIARFMGYSDSQQFIQSLIERRNRVIEIIEQHSI